MTCLKPFSYLISMSLLAAILVFPATVMADEEEEEDWGEWGDEYAAYLSDEPPTFDDNMPVVDTFNESVLITSQTIEQLGHKRWGFNIQHRMGELGTDSSNLFGIYAPANIRLALKFGIHDRVQLGVGSTKMGTQQDLNAKVILLRQTTPGGMPVSLSYYGQTTMRAGPSENFDKFSHRFGYLHELMVARKFHERLSLQATASFTHFNLVNRQNGYRHDNLALTLIGRVGLTSRMALVFEMGQGQLLSWAYPSEAAARSKPLLGLGAEMLTTGHAFQVFLSSTIGILRNDIYVYNPHSLTDGTVFLGFNMTRDYRL